MNQGWPRSSVAARVAAAVAAVLSCAAVAPTAHSASWIFDPVIEGGGLTNDNYTLARPRERQFEVTGVYADAALAFRLESPRTRWRIEPRVRLTEFTDEDDPNTKDYYLSAGTSHRGERFEVGLAADWYDEDIISAELPGARAGDLELGQGNPTTGSGQIIVDNRRTIVMASPFAAFDLSERTTLRVDATLFDASFDNEVPGAQQSYRSSEAGASIARRFSPQSSWSLRLQTSRLEPDGPTPDTDVLGALVQWDYRIAERVQAYARAGVDRADIGLLRPGGPGGALIRTTAEETTPLFGAGARWAFPRSDLYLDLLRNVDASGAGQVVTRDEIRLSAGHSFTIKLRGVAAAYVVREEEVADIVSFARRDYAAASVGLEWRLRRQLTVGGRLDWSQQEYEGDPQKADGTGLRLFLRYQPRRVD